jgi:hypothetical protein
VVVGLADEYSGVCDWSAREVWVWVLFVAWSSLVVLKYVSVSNITMLIHCITSGLLSGDGLCVEVLIFRPWETGMRRVASANIHVCSDSEGM